MKDKKGKSWSYTYGISSCVYRYRNPDPSNLLSWRKKNNLRMIVSTYNFFLHYLVASYLSSIATAAIASQKTNLMYFYTFKYNINFKNRHNRHPFTANLLIKQNRRIAVSLSKKLKIRNVECWEDSKNKETSEKMVGLYWPLMGKSKHVVGFFFGGTDTTFEEKAIPVTPDECSKMVLLGNYAGNKITTEEGESKFIAEPTGEGK